MIRIKQISRFVLASFLAVAGTAHFLFTPFYVPIMPPYLPFPFELIYLSGGLEIAFGVLLLVPRVSRLAAWGIFALLIAVFPANVYVYQHQDLLPAPPWAHLLRLPLQGMFLLWAYWHTRLGGDDIPD